MDITHTGTTTKVTYAFDLHGAPIVDDYDHIPMSPAYAEVITSDGRLDRIHFEGHRAAAGIVYRDRGIADLTFKTYEDGGEIVTRVDLSGEMPGGHLEHLIKIGQLSDSTRAVIYDLIAAALNTETDRTNGEEFTPTEVETVLTALEAWGEGLTFNHITASLHEHRAEKAADAHADQG